LPSLTLIAKQGICSDASTSPPGVLARRASNATRPALLIYVRLYKLLLLLFRGVCCIARLAIPRGLPFLLRPICTGHHKPAEVVQLRWSPVSPTHRTQSTRRIDISHMQTSSREDLCIYPADHIFGNIESRPTHARKHWARAASTPMIYESLARWSLANTLRMSYPP
jgi:hypothetical protein